MGITTVRPDATVQLGNFTITGAATAHAAVNDATGTGGDQDGTYVTGPTTAYDATRGTILDLPPISIPSGARIVGVRVRMRARDNSSWPFTSLLRARPRLVTASGAAYYGSGVASNWGQTAMTYYQGGWETRNPVGTEWTTTDLANLQVLLTSQTDNFGGGGRIAEVWVDVQYNERPTVTVTAPTEGSNQGTPLPTVQASYSDPDGDPPIAYRVKIFTAAQYGAGGFDPETSTPYIDSGWVASNANPFTYTPSFGLGNDTYRAYVWGSHSWPGGSFDSLPDYNQFGVNVTPPPVPTLGISAEAPLSRVQLVATRGGTSPATDGFDFEFSDNNGATWATVRFGANVAIAGTQATLYDYESTHNVARQYRTRAWRLQSGVVIRSGWSATQTATIVTKSTWLTNPYNPAQNMRVRFEGDALAHDSEEQAEVLWPLGRKFPVVISGTIQADTYSLTFPFASEAEFLAFEALRKSQNVLLLKSGRNWARYLKLVGTRSVVEDRTTAEELPWWYTVTVQAVEQDRPA